MNGEVIDSYYLDGKFLLKETRKTTKKKSKTQKSRKFNTLFSELCAKAVELASKLTTVIKLFTLLGRSNVGNFHEEE